MNFFSINKITPAFIFSFFVFAVMPLAYSDRLLDPELSLRFICLALIVFFFFLYFLFKRNKIQLPPANQKLTLVFAVYIFLNVLSLLFATNRSESLYELIRLLLFLFFYLSLLILLQKNGNVLPVIIKNINIGIVIFSVIGLYQLYPDIVKFIEKEKPFLLKLSWSSTLGNKNFYAETLLMALPFIVYGITIFKKFWKVISILNLILILITIFFLQTASVWLGLLLSSFLLCIFYRKLIFENKKIRNGAAVTLFFILIIGVAIIFSKPAFLKATASKFNIALKYINDPDAMENSSMENDNSIYERIILWRNSFKMIKDHPFFGVGLGEWKIYFPKYGMGVAPYMNSGMIRFEKPHNDFLLTCCETGIPGLVCYSALLIIALNYCKKISKQKRAEKDKLLMRLIAAGLTGFLVISFFGYPSQRPFTMILFMLMLAVVQSEYLKTFPGKENLKTKKIYIILFIAGILISALGLNIGKQRLKAEMHLANALRAQKYKNWGIMIREATRAESSFFRMDFTSTPISWYLGFAYFYSGNQDQALINFKEAEKLNPYHFNVLNDLGTCYDLQGNSEMAKVYYQKALNINPFFPDAIINLSVLYYNAGNIDSAYTFISKDNLERNLNYKKDLKVILHAKAQNIVQQVTDSAKKANLSQKINDEKWLLSVHKEAKSTNSKLEDLLLAVKK